MVADSVNTSNGNIESRYSSLNSTNRFGIDAVCDRDNPDCEYLIANICLYLVSARLSILVCHYENSQESKGRSPLFSRSNNSPFPASPHSAQCDCASSTLAMADVERTQHLISQIHKLDAINTFRGPALASPTAALLPSTSR
ncbi:hypothetical protein IW150_006153, partial [Coemansia sp. RSA 2607]